MELAKGEDDMHMAYLYANAFPLFSDCWKNFFSGSKTSGVQTPTWADGVLLPKFLTFRVQSTVPLLEPSAPMQPL